MKRPILKVAKSGFDIRTANPKDLTIDSTKNQFKVHMDGTGVVSFSAKSPGSSYQVKYVDIDHNLGYQPSHLFYVKRSDSKVRQFAFLGTGSTGPTNVSVGMDRLDDNTIRLYFYVWDLFLNGYDAFDVDYRYIIYVDPNKNAWS